jgi:membrane fusion protein, multidrug efflux system
MKKTWVVLLLIVLAGAAAGYWYFYASEAPSTTATTVPKAAKGKAGRGGFDPNRPTPVSAEAARTGDVSIYLSGLGTVTPLRSVTVRSRVEGELLRVAFREGQSVKEGDLLAEIDPRPFRVQLMQAEGQLARNQALLANARMDLERYEMLFRQDSIARQEVDTQASLVRQYEGAIKADQSQVANARLQLDYARIHAPISGRLGLRLVDPGNVVRPGDANGIVVITQLQPVAVVFSIPQDQLPQVLKKRGEKLPVEAWDRENRQRIASGTFMTVDNQIDPATGTIKVKAEFPNDDGTLFPNQFVNARMLVETRRGAVLIPAAALQRGSQGQLVYVVKDDGTVSVRPVRLGPAEGTRVAVEAGLAAGERVVVDGLDRLREGARVEVSDRR